MADPCPVSVPVFVSVSVSVPERLTTKGTKNTKGIFRVLLSLIEMRCSEIEWSFEGRQADSPKTQELLGDLGALVVKTGGRGNVIRYPASMTTNPLSAVTFDAGGTMIYCDPSPGEIYAHHLSRHGRPVQAEEVGPVFRDAWAQMQRQTVPGQDRYNSVAGGELAWWGAFVREVLRRLDHDAPWEPLLEDLYAAFCEASVWKVYPETISTLEALVDRGVRLAVISNWDRRLPDILRSLEIFEIFETVTVSSIEGVEKPSSAIFHRTLERMELSAGETIHIGDSPLEDYSGAETAGLGAALIDRHELFVEEPYRRISSLEEILDLVE